MNQITKRKKKKTFANSKSHLRKNLEIRFIVRISGAKSYFCYFLALKNYSYTLVANFKKTTISIDGNFYNCNKLKNK